MVAQEDMQVVQDTVVGDHLVVGSYLVLEGDNCFLVEGSCYLEVGS